MLTVTASVQSGFTADLPVSVSSPRSAETAPIGASQRFGLIFLQSVRGLFASAQTFFARFLCPIDLTLVPSKVSVIPDEGQMRAAGADETEVTL
jgi:hypothetical protein